MNEKDARAVVLVRAIETTEPARAVWSDDDREWAGRAAAEVVGSAASPDAFLARRAALSIERLGVRQPLVPRLLGAFAWRPWVGWVVPLAALALGVATDRLGPSQRVDVLAFPLLGLIAWNLAVYVVIGLRALARLAGRSAAPGPIAQAVARLGGITPRAVPGGSNAAPLGTAAAVYGADWARLASPLWRARVGRTLHLAAALLAAGAVAGLYLRGIVHEYRAGWDSTFLDADAVHRLLSVALAPGAALTGIAVPDAARLEAIRFGAGGAGENAADWIHLYAATIGALVIAPRLLLALLDRTIERWRATRFTFRTDEPYYQRLLGTLREVPLRVRVVPYSFQPTDEARRGLEALLMRAMGPRTTVVHAASVAYGSDAVPSGAPAARDGAADTMVALFSMAATPEEENHGAFVEALAAGSGGVPPVAIVDEAAFRARFVGQMQRLDERRDAWRRLLGGHRVEPVFVDLAATQAGDAATAAALDAALHRRVAA